MEKKEHHLMKNEANEVVEKRCIVQDINQNMSKKDICICIKNLVSQTNFKIDTLQHEIEQELVKSEFEERKLNLNEGASTENINMKQSLNDLTEFKIKVNNLLTILNIRKDERPITEEDRRNVVKMILDGEKSYHDALKQYNIPIECLIIYFEEYFGKEKEFQINSMCHKEDEEAMLDTLWFTENNLGSQIREIISYLLSKNRIVNEERIQKFLTECDINWKTQFLIPQSWNGIITIIKRETFIKHITLKPELDRVYISLFTLNILDEPFKGLKFIIKPNKLNIGIKEKGIMLIGSLSKGRLDYKYLFFNSEMGVKRAQKDLINYCLNKVIAFHQNTIFIVDNTTVPFEVIKDEVIKSHQVNNNQIIELPPFSTFLNPIEIAFYHIKNHLKNSTINNIDQIGGYLRQAVKLFCLKKHIIYYFDQVDSYNPYCLEGKAIKGKILKF